MSLLEQLNERSKQFHAEIARRAALVPAKQDRSYSIPNTPFGVDKIAPPTPAVIPPPRNPDPDHWSQMWFYDLVFGEVRPKTLKVEDIYRAVALEYGVSKSEMNSDLRFAEIVMPRQVAFYVARVLTGRSFPELGRRMGGKDHTTVLHAFRKIERLIATDTKLAVRIEKIKASL